VDEPTVVVGLVTKAHGLRGEVLVEIRSDNPDRWAPGSVVLDEAGRRLTVGGVRGRAGRAIVTFEEVGDRDAAEALRGRTLEAAFLAPLPDELRFGQGLVNAAKLSGTLDPEVLRFLNTAGVQLQSFLERSRDLLAPRVRVATTAERDRG